MFIKNEDINLMIKMENVIGMNNKAIFGKKHDKSVLIDGMEITYYDFVDYISLIDKILNNKKKLSEKANAYNKSHPEKHRKYNRDYERRKRKEKQLKANVKKVLEMYKKEKMVCIGGEDIEDTETLIKALSKILPTQEINKLMKEMEVE